MDHAQRIVILGPTAGGKSELAVTLAERFSGGCGAGGQIVSADSMQIYRHLDAGTAKPSAELRRRVPHHLIDIVEPTQRFTVADWLGRARDCIDQIEHQGSTPIVVGGTNLYIKALLAGMFDGPAADAALRARLAAVTVEQLHDRLRKVDPAAAAQVHHNDRKRIVRALEVFELTGKPISQWQQQWQGPSADGESSSLEHMFRLIGLAWPVEQINRRINLRVKAMFYPQQVDADLAREVCPAGESLPDEVRRLEGAGLLGAQAREALGYKQLLEQLHGRMSLEEAFERTKVLTRRFAKQQRTWLRRFEHVTWFDADQATAEQIAERVVAEPESS